MVFYSAPRNSVYFSFFHHTLVQVCLPLRSPMNKSVLLWKLPLNETVRIEPRWLYLFSVLILVYTLFYPSHPLVPVCHVCCTQLQTLCFYYRPAMSGRCPTWPIGTNWYIQQPPFSCPHQCPQMAQVSHYYVFLILIWVSLLQTEHAMVPWHLLITKPNPFCLW